MLSLALVALKDETGVLGPALGLESLVLGPGLELSLTLIMRPNRTHMSDSLLESLVFLKCNSSLFVV